MRSRLSVAVAFALFLLAPFVVQGQMEIFERPAPEGQQKPIEAFEAPRSRSLTTGANAVTVPLDDTGVVDWRFSNPRKPQSVPEGYVIQFENRTDRTFEVSTQVALPANLVPASLPSTVPLAIYDALRIGQERPSAKLYETIGDYERNLIEEAKKSFPIFSGTLEKVMELEIAIRASAEKAAVEKSARETLLKAAQDRTTAVDRLPALEEMLAAARKDRLNAVQRVAALIGTDDHLAKDRKDLIAHFEKVGRELRKESAQRRAREYAEGQQKRKEILAQNLSEEDEAEFLEDEAAARRASERTDLMKIALVDTAIYALKNQSSETSLFIPLHRALPSIKLEDCSVSASVSCSASVYIYANGTGVFPYEVLLYQADPTGAASFNVKFFEEDGAPARPVAYLIANDQVGKPGAPKSVTTVKAVAGFGAAKEPFLKKAENSRNCPFLCPDKPYKGEDKSHYTGSGRVDVMQTYGNLLDGKVSLAFKSGDLGGGDGTTDVKLSQYRFNIYSEYGLTFHYGKFDFLAPSSGIAVSESGEGARLAWHNYAVSRIIKRESGTGSADQKDEDDSVWMLEANDIGIAEFFERKDLSSPDEGFVRFFRTMSLVGLMGKDRKGPVEREDPYFAGLKEADFRAHEYKTLGGQVNFTRPPMPGSSGAGAFYGTVAGYWSERDAGEKDAPCNNALHVCDGKGAVGVLTLTHPFKVDEDGKSTGNVTFTAGIGSTDDPATPFKDEGYIGETASFAPDQIFFSKFAGAVSNRKFLDITSLQKSDTVGGMDFRARDLGVVGLGQGLSNKEYYGVKYVRNDVSLLQWLACVKPDPGFKSSTTNMLACLVPKSDIRSRSTVVTLNHYRLRRPLIGTDRDAGFEADLEFNVETPRGVKINLKGGYYWPGKAMDPFIADDAWSLSGGLSLSF